jgi:ribosomal protein S18 acetylase RimI-like enzyme
VSDAPPGAAAAELTVGEATQVDDQLVAAFERLTPQLSRSNPPPGRAVLQEIVDSPATVLLVARLGDLIVGSLTLVQFVIPTARRAWIEDVVVDESARGRGVGEALNRAALARALADGARTVDLTSRPSREAANRLYQRLGFEARETNVYRHTLAP